MKKFLSLIIVLLSPNCFSQSITFQDNMNGDNSVTGLQARGWIVVDNDGGGFSPTWFQGNPDDFSSFEGPDSGYVAADFDGANNSGFLDHWLISPSINYSVGDTLYFYLRSPNQMDYDDSLSVLFSQNASTNLANFVFVGRVLSPTSDWQLFYAVFNYTGPIRFAFRYIMFDTDARTLSIGIDNVVVISHPSTIQLSKSFTFGDPSQSSSYRLIGIPGNNNLPVTTFFNTGTQKVDWNVFYDNGAATDFLLEFNGQATFNFTPGKGFWALSRNAINVSREVNTVSLTGNAFAINLHSGWNIISNPFEKNVTLADIRNANNLPNAVIHSFNGNFTQPTTMVTYEGYYFLNPDGRASLSIPYSFGSSLPKSNEQPYFLSEKSLSMKLSTEDFSSEATIGFDETSQNGYDEKDYFAPPGNFEEINIRLINKNLSSAYKELFIEHRPEIGEGQSFDLQIKNETGKKAKLIVNGVKNFSEDEIYLLDERLKKLYNLKEKNEIVVSENIKDNKFSLLIGKQNFIDSYKDDTAPKEFTLYQNYPNPFNPVTLIRYQIPEKDHLSIKVYDIIGNLVKILVDETKEQGYYEVEFDGNSLSSGIYLYEFSSGSVRSIKKMTLIK